MSESSEKVFRQKSAEKKPPGRVATRKGFFVYIARCSDATLYTGFTVDPDARIKRHNRGSGARYTRSRRPVRLAYLQEAPSRREALAMEKRIKKMKRGEKLFLCAEYGRAKGRAHAREQPREAAEGLALSADDDLY